MVLASLVRLFLFTSLSSINETFTTVEFEIHQSKDDILYPVDVILTPPLDSVIALTALPTLMRAPSPEQENYLVDIVNELVNAASDYYAITAKQINNDRWQFELNTFLADCPVCCCQS